MRSTNEKPSKDIGKESFIKYSFIRKEIKQIENDSINPENLKDKVIVPESKIKEEKKYPDFTITSHLASEMEIDKKDDFPKRKLFFVAEFQNGFPKFYIEIENKRGLMETFKAEIYQDFREKSDKYQNLKICSIEFDQTNYETDINKIKNKIIEVNFIDNFSSILKLHIETANFYYFNNEILIFSKLNNEHFIQKTTISTTNNYDSKNEIFLIFSWYFFNNFFIAELNEVMKYFNNHKLCIIVKDQESLTTSIFDKILLSKEDYIVKFINGICLIGELYYLNSSLIENAKEIFPTLKQIVNQLSEKAIAWFRKLLNEDKIYFYKRLALILASYYLKVNRSIYLELKTFKNFHMIPIEREICKLILEKYPHYSQKTLIVNFIEYYAAESFQDIKNVFNSLNQFFYLIKEALSQTELTFDSNALTEFGLYFTLILELEQDLFTSVNKVKEIIENINKILDPQLRGALLIQLQKRFISECNKNCKVTFSNILDILEVLDFSEKELQLQILYFTEKFFLDYLSEIDFHKRICLSRNILFKKFLFFAYALILNKSVKQGNHNKFNLSRMMLFLVSIEKECDPEGLIDKSDIIALIFNELNPNFNLILQTLIELNQYSKNIDERKFLTLKFKEHYKEILNSHDLLIIFNTYTLILKHKKESKDFEDSLLYIENN